jgi:biopolymer transport protein ExbD
MNITTHLISAFSPKKHMAEEISKPGTGRGNGLHRCKKLSTKIDLTPMVDLGFLLITFFILTTAWTTPKHLQLLLPAGQESETLYGRTTALTLIPLEGERAFFYNGDLNWAVSNNNYGVINWKDIRQIIMRKQLALDASPKYTRKDLCLIIKPTDETHYKYIIQLMDEVLINDLKHYSFVDISGAEKNWLKKKSLLR